MFKLIPYSKLLFTCNEKYVGPDTVIFENFKNENEIGDILTNRDFYKDGKIFEKMSEVENGKK